MSDIRTFEEFTPDIHASAWVDHNCTVIGDVAIGADSSIWPGTVIRGDINAIRIGERTNIQDGSILHNSHDSEFMPGGSPLVIGDDVTVGHGVILHGCEIHDLCLIGMGATVMDRSVVQRHVIVAAGSLVPGGKVLESGYLYAGSPAKQVRRLTEDQVRYFAYSAAHYVKLARRHREGSLPV